MVNINIDDANKFFVDPKTQSMPKWMIASVADGNYIEFGNYRAQALEYRHMHLFAPDIERVIEKDKNGYHVPIVRILETPEYLVFNPRTGEYVDSFRIEDPRASMSDEDRQRADELLDKLRTIPI